MAECSRHTYGLTAATTMSSVTVGKYDYCPSPTVLLDPSKLCTDDCVARKKVASRQGFAGIGCQGSGWGRGGGGGNSSKRFSAYLIVLPLREDQEIRQTPESPKE